MVVAYLSVILSIIIRSPMDIPLPGMSENDTGRFTGLSAQTLNDNLYCKLLYSSENSKSFGHSSKRKIIFEK